MSGILRSVRSSSVDEGRCLQWCSEVIAWKSGETLNLERVGDLEDGTVLIKVLDSIGMSGTSSANNFVMRNSLSRMTSFLKTCKKHLDEGLIVELVDIYPEFKKPHSLINTIYSLSQTLDPEVWEGPRLGAYRRNLKRKKKEVETPSDSDNPWKDDPLRVNSKKKVPAVTGSSTRFVGRQNRRGVRAPRQRVSSSGDSEDQSVGKQKRGVTNEESLRDAIHANPNEESIHRPFHPPARGVIRRPGYSFPKKKEAEASEHSHDVENSEGAYPLDSPSKVQENAPTDVLRERNPTDNIEDVIQISDDAVEICAAEMLGRVYEQAVRSAGRRSSVRDLLEECRSGISEVQDKAVTLSLTPQNGSGSLSPEVRHVISEDFVADSIREVMCKYFDERDVFEVPEALLDTPDGARSPEDCCRSQLETSTTILEEPMQITIDDVYFTSHVSSNASVSGERGPNQVLKVDSKSDTTLSGSSLNSSPVDDLLETLV